MKVINIKDLLLKTKDGFTKTYNAIVTKTKNVAEDLDFALKADRIKVINHPNKEKISKLMFVILDEKNNFMYIKADDSFNTNSSIITDCIIKTKDNKKYEVVSVDHEKKYEYLLKNNDKYKSTQCYKAYLKNID